LPRCGSVARGLADEHSDIGLDVYWASAPTEDERITAVEGAGWARASTPASTRWSGRTGTRSTASRSGRRQLGVEETFDLVVKVLPGFDIGPVRARFDGDRITTG